MASNPAGDWPPYWSIYLPMQPVPNWYPPYWTLTAPIVPHIITDPPDIEEVCKHKPKLWGSFEELNRNKHK